MIVRATNFERPRGTEYELVIVIELERRLLRALVRVGPRKDQRPCRPAARAEVVEADEGMRVGGAAEVCVEEAGGYVEARGGDGGYDRCSGGWVNQDVLSSQIINCMTLVDRFQ